MPSDDLVRLAAEALAVPRERFRSAVAATAVQVRALVDVSRSPDDVRRTRHVVELGPFAADRLDLDRFSTLDAGADLAAPGGLEVFERALTTLAALLDAGTDLYRVTVPPGGVPAAAVAQALAHAGRAFGAARAVELARTGHYRAADHDAWFETFPFARWNRAERRIAPPLVVEVEGGDAQAGGLEGFLDGELKLVLVVREPAPPAPLVRLVTPGVLVVQTADPAELDRLATFEGPAVAALVPDSAARFVHDPAGGPTPAERITVAHVPDEPRASIGRYGVFQQIEELRQLGALAVPAAARTSPSADGSAPEAVEPADKLAAWLLRQANLSDLG